MDALRQVAAVALVFGLLAVALWALRRRGLLPVQAGRRASRRLQSLERLALSPRHTLHLVRVADRTLLIGVYPDGCALLETLPLGAADRAIGEAR